MTTNPNKSNPWKNFFYVVGLIGLTCLALIMATHSSVPTTLAKQGTPGLTVEDKAMMISSKLVQNRFLKGSDGNVSLSLTLTGSEPQPETPNQNAIQPHVDMVIVLDRSGSMSGQKIQHAKEAIGHLISLLTPKDRFALVSYSNNVTNHGSLSHVTSNYLDTVTSMVASISAGGGTNLGAGLQNGIQSLNNAGNNGNTKKLILISDGLANQGITDPNALRHMAADATEQSISISTAGVGNDFNEYLMTAIADSGMGAYYYIENPPAFASVFSKELHHARSVAARSIKIQIPLPKGVSLVHAGGYPITMSEGMATFYPGNLIGGQTRQLFLTLRFPSHQLNTFNLSGITVSYNDPQGQSHRLTLPDAFTIACVADPSEVISSMDKDAWTDQVIRDTYNQLKEAVARDIKSGNREAALKKIEEYEESQSRMNAVMASPQVTENITKDVPQLRQQVQSTFSGSAAEVAKKQRKNAKAIQYEGYKGMRDMK